LQEFNLALSGTAKPLAGKVGGESEGSKITPNMAPGGPESLPKSSGSAPTHESTTPTTAPEKQGAKLNKTIEALAKKYNMTFSPGETAFIKGYNYVMLAVAAGYILASENKLQAVAQTAISAATSSTAEFLTLLLTRSFGLALFVPFLLGIKSDSATFNASEDKGTEREYLIQQIIHQKFPDVVSEWTGGIGAFLGGPDPSYEVEKEEEYNQIKPLIEKLLDHPYTLRDTTPIVPEKFVPAPPPYSGPEMSSAPPEE